MPRTLRTSTRTLVVAALSAVLMLAVGTLADSVTRATSSRAKPAVTLSSVPTRYVDAPIAIRGRVAGFSGSHRLLLQHYSPTQHRWTLVTSRYVRAGSYQFASRRWSRPATLAFRTVLLKRGHAWAYSNVMRVRVIARPTSPGTVPPSCANAPSASTCPKPASTTETRTIDVPYCPHLTVTINDQSRTINWTWDSGSKKWVEDPSAWKTDSSTERAASADDCVHIVDSVPANAALPDLRVLDLTNCTKTDSDATSGTCFKIEPDAPYNPDYPSLEHKKLLKFGVTTLDVGAGPSEIIADRSAADSSDWKAYQSFYDKSGKLLGSTVDPHVQYYFAGDGHNHWHVKDFDEYSLLNASGDQVATAEKHGYCMYDNYGPLASPSNRPDKPVYTADTSCGKGLPNALTIVHGLSAGWGDTYFTYLPDQAIDITGLPNGTYTVQIHADLAGAVVESNDNNNTASVKVTINDDTVTVVPGSSKGGA